MKTQYQTILTGAVLSLLVFQVLLLVILAFFPYVQDPGFSIPNAKIYTFLAPLSTVFLLGLLYALILRLGASEARRSSRKFERLVRFLAEPFRTLVSSIKTRPLSDSAQSFRTLSHPRLLLVVSVATSVLLALVPYRPDLNPTGNLIGIDGSVYAMWISQMLSKPVPQAIQYSFIEGLDGSRPLFLIILYLVASLGVSPSQVIEYMPMVLSPPLSLSSYTFVRFGHGSKGFAGLTALFTPSSFYIPVGLWGGYFWIVIVGAGRFLGVY